MVANAPDGKTLPNPVNVVDKHPKRRIPIHTDPSRNHPNPPLIIRLLLILQPTHILKVPTQHVRHDITTTTTTPATNHPETTRQPLPKPQRTQKVQHILPPPSNQPQTHEARINNQTQNQVETITPTKPIAKNGKKYVGMTSNLPQRIQQHQTGKGSAVTKQNKVVSFSHIYQHSSKAAAKSAERRNYYAAKTKHGANNVRGAGNTKTF